jgi:hypothetical protein
MPWRISALAMSAWMSEKPMTKSGLSLRISPILAEVNALTLRDRRAHGEAADADDTILFAERVQGFSRFLGQADDAAGAMEPGVGSGKLDIGKAIFGNCS